MEMVFSFLESINSILWHPTVLIALLMVGLLFSIWSRWGQYMALTHGIKVIRGAYDSSSAPGAISHFQALSAALSATVGLGNIAGVAIAISLGGPGAVFWMWVVGFIGMALKMTEVIQSMLYRDVTKPEEPHGGPMFVVKRGLENRGWRRTGSFLGGLFCLTLLASTITGGNMFQAWNVAEISFSYFGWPKMITGTILFVLVCLVIIGGIKRIGRVAGKLVPIMCGTYILAAIAVMFHFRFLIPETLALIIHSALPDWLGGKAPDPTGAFIGGTAGFAFMKGMQRALFSNEAGQGSAPIAHSSARTHEPVREGIVAGLEPFVDTLCICTMTAMVILLSSVWKRPVDRVFGMEPETSAETGKWVFYPTPIALDNEIKVGTGVFALVFPDPAQDPRIRLQGSIVQREDGTNWISWEQRVFNKRPLLVENGYYLEYKGATLTAIAFDRAWPGLGRWVVPICVWLFALSTIISWSYYGEQGTVYLFGDKAIPYYRWAYCLLIPISSSPLIATEGQLDAISTLGTGLMLWVNIPIMLIFGKEAMAALADYKTRLKSGQFNQT
ncbi:MAG: sodium:alanine symporter family protein [Acidobacteria bacterium]|nr:sodium:alanine symporter family protein [Acidobacteriota bacterium]